jgi:hypothetical protein
MQNFSSKTIFIGDLEVKLPDETLDNWVVVKQQSIKYVKGDIILEKFNKDFPHAVVDSYDVICDLASRSTKISEWLVNANTIYSELAEMPLYLDGLVEPKIYKGLTQDIQRINETIGSFSQSRQQLAEKYKSELKILEKKEKEAINKIKGDNKFLRVLTLNTTSLPLTLQLMINGYSPSNSENLQESQKVFAREMLINYKVSLIKKIIEDPNFKVDIVIDDNQLK